MVDLDFKKLDIPYTRMYDGFVVMGMRKIFKQEGLSRWSEPQIVPLYCTNCADVAVEAKQKIEEGTDFNCYIARCARYQLPDSAMFVIND